MASIDIKNFLKFGSEDHVRDMWENGTIYCNTLEYFRRLEDRNLRGDNYEGTYRIINYPGESEITLTISETGQAIPLKTSNLHFREFYSDLKGNIYCLTAVTVQEVVQSRSLKLDLRLSEFGSHFLLVKDNQRFYDMLIDSFVKNNLKVQTGFVKYYDKKKINGELDLFHKPNEFGYQKEFRILIQNQEIAPIKFQIGSLKDIADIYETKDLGTLEYKYAPQ